MTATAEWCWTNKLALALLWLGACGAAAGAAPGAAIHGSADQGQTYPCPPAHSWCHDSVDAAALELHLNITYGSAFNRLSGT